MNGNEKRTDYIKVMLSEKEKENIKRSAEEQGLTISEYIRFLYESREDVPFFMYSNDDIQEIVNSVIRAEKDLHNTLYGIELMHGVGQKDIQELYNTMTQYKKMFDEEFVRIMTNRSSAEKYARRMVKDWKKKQKEREGIKDAVHKSPQNKKDTE